MSRIGRLRATVAVPQRGDLPAGTLDRVGVAVTDRVPAALARRFSSVAMPSSRADPAAHPVVVIRRLSVSASVPASASAEEIAERLADRVARAIRSAPTDGQVRYPSRAGHLAAFVAALSAGYADSWVFEAFAGSRQLAPLTALRSLAERHAVPVPAVLGELARTDGLFPLLIRAPAADVARTWALCLAEPHPRLAPDEALRRLTAEPTSAAELARLGSVAALALFLTGRAVQLGQPAADAVAIASAVATSPLGLTGAPAAGAPAPTAGAEPASSVGSSPLGPAAFAADGAPAFLLLPSFSASGLGQLAPGQRAAVLAAATRTSPFDPAIALAAGPADEERQPVDIAAVVQRALLAESRLGLERLEILTVAGSLVVRDAGSGSWLAVLDPDCELTPARIASVLIPPLAALPYARTDPGESDRARLAADLSYLLPDTDPAPHELTPDELTPDELAERRAVAVAARAGLARFARRLTGFAASSLPYLADRFLPPGGVVTELGDAVLVQLPSPPLLVVLALAGLDRTVVEVPWLPGPVTITHADQP